MTRKTITVLAVCYALAPLSPAAGVTAGMRIIALVPEKPEGPEP